MEAATVNSYVWMLILPVENEWRMSSELRHLAVTKCQELPAIAGGSGSTQKNQALYG